MWFCMDMAKIRTFNCTVFTRFVFLGFGLAYIFFHVAPNKKPLPSKKKRGLV